MIVPRVPYARHNLVILNLLVGIKRNSVILLLTLSYFLKNSFTYHNVVVFKVN